MDPFERLGIEPAFRLDSEQLAKRHRDLSRALHPDRFSGRPASERRDALGKAIEVNEAYRSLKSPIHRAQAILQRLGVAEPEQGGGFAPPEFLMEIMELREELRNAALDKNEARIEELDRSIETQAKAVEESLAKELEAGLAGGQFDAEAALEQLGALRYYQRFREEAEAHLDELV